MSLFATNRNPILYFAERTGGDSSCTDNDNYAIRELVAPVPMGKQDLLFPFSLLPTTT